MTHKFLYVITEEEDKENKGASSGTVIIDTIFSYATTGHTIVPVLNKGKRSPRSLL